MRTLIGLFQNPKEATETISDLRKLGASPTNISVLAPISATQAGGELGLSKLDVPGLGPIAGMGPMTNYLNQATAKHAPNAIVSALTQMGVPERDAVRYVEGVRRGYTLETVAVDDAKAGEALQIMRNHAIQDDQTRRSAGDGDLSGRGEGIKTSKTGTGELRGGRDTDEAVLPVIIEELQVGTREVEAGGVRVATKVEDVPAEQDVTLRQEHINVERRAVNRDASATDAAFEDRTVEVVAKAEEPVITKQARVIEEIVITKDVDTRQQRVRDTVRRTDVDVEQLGSKFDESQYRQHFSSEFAKDKDYDFSSYRPAYKFGHELRGDDRFSGDAWDNVETNARQTWEEKNPGTWDRFKGAVKHAWERAKGG